LINQSQQYKATNPKTFAFSHFVRKPQIKGQEAKLHISRKYFSSGLVPTTEVVGLIDEFEISPQVQLWELKS
jgi:hypothetical protein